MINSKKPVSADFRFVNEVLEVDGFEVQVVDDVVVVASRFVHAAEQEGVQVVVQGRHGGRRGPSGGNPIHGDHRRRNHLDMTVNRVKIVYT